jgi:hypothetical protein
MTTTKKRKKCRESSGCHYQLSIDILGFVKCSSTFPNLSIEPLLSRRLEKDESLRTFWNIAITCSLVTPCRTSYSICLQIFVRRPYFLWFLRSHPDASGDKPVTYFTTVFSICSTCHSIIGKLFCTKKLPTI